ncbi:MAG: hypothetical protein ANABAC_1345 [Anaerolineae bacterium]|jgi:hypothetical protein|nr:MAG: hypothetical protein ANABAC_1345 [Anaerolineae bacterium]
MKKRPLLLARILVGLLIGAWFLSACAARAPEREVNIVSGESYVPQEIAPAAPAQPELKGDSSGFVSSVPSSTERMVIKNAKLSLIVKDPPAAMDSIAEMAEQMGGFVVSAELYQTTTESGKEVPRATITIRVPAEKLNPALDEIRALSDQLPENENITSQDITAEYTDLDSRLRNLKRAEEQLQEILDQAYSTEDVLSVFQQLTQVREQIEVIEGQMKYYREAVALSSISVDLIAEEAVEPLTIGRWQPVGVARDALQALINALQFLINVVIWMVIFILPVLILLYGIFFIPLRALWRFFRRRRKPKAVASSESSSPPPAS